MARHTIAPLPALVAATALSAGSHAFAQCDPGWLPADKPTGIGENGNTAHVCAEWDPDGAGPLPSRLVVGGSFYFAGGRLANSIAYWDGTGWHPMGDGLRGLSLPSVRALHVHNGELYAAGLFLFSDTNFLHNVARWDGAAWQPLGDGTNNSVLALASFGGDLIAGGGFQSAGGVPAARIARWDGTQWHAMGDGFNGAVTSLAVYDGSLYAGGLMTSSGFTTIDAIGRWNGSAWVGVGGGLHNDFNTQVQALCVYNSELIAIGRFTSAGLTPVNNIARWNGTAWQSTGAALDLPPTSAAVVDSDLVIASTWHLSSGDVVPNVHRWNGAAWSALPVVDGSPARVVSFRGQIATVGGIFADADGERAGGVLVYDGTEWQAVGEQGLAHNTVQAIGTYQGDVVIARLQDRLPQGFGDFGLSMPIVRWSNGAVVEQIGMVDVYSNLVPYVQDIQQIGSDLYICGTFDTVNGVEALNIAKWNGTTWSPLGDGIGPRGIGTIALGEYNGEVIVGGAFLEDEGSPGNSITRWDGTSWLPLGSGLQYITPTFTGAGEVHVMLPYQGKLLVLGSFTHAGGVPANSVALWDGTTWTAFPGGLPDTIVTGASFYNGDLVISGIFFNSQANGALRWDGTAWQPLGAGLGGANGDWGYARNVIPVGSDLYFGGFFTSAGGATANNIAKWDGTNWSALGDGIERVIYQNGPQAEVVSMIAHNGELLIGGAFNKANGQGAANFVRYCLGAAPAGEKCCRGTTCIEVASGACTGTVAGSASVVVGTCTGNTAAGCCFGDYDHNGTKDITDIFTFLNAWFSASIYADITDNGAGQPDITDIFTFLNAWFGTCD